MVILVVHLKIVENHHHHMQSLTLYYTRYDVFFYEWWGNETETSTWTISEMDGKQSGIEYRELFRGNFKMQH